MEQTNREYWIVFSYDNCNYEGTPLYICKTQESAFEAFHKAISESEFFRDNDNFEIDDVRLIADSDPNGDGDYYEYIKVVKMPVFK